MTPPVIQMSDYRPSRTVFATQELIIDSFAGGGGASTGIEAALGRPVDIAINHNREAILMHEVNHPQTVHFNENIWDVNPRDVCAGRPVGLLWASPDCRHFSKAKGGRPVEKTIRGLAWVVVRWAATVRPRCIILENVEEFTGWGPLIKGHNGDLRPDPKRRGHTFRIFTNALSRQGYKVEYRELRACDYGAPTIRKRLFLIARCDDQPIVWPEATHGDPKSQAVISKRLKPWRTAADCIDFSIPVQSIFGRKKPLAEATMRRIAKGIMRYVVDSADPFIVTYYGSKGPDFRGQPLDEPLRTQTTENRHALVTPVLAPFITEHANASSQRNMPAEEPLRTQCAQVKGGHFALVEAFLAKHYTGVIGSRLENPLGTVTSVDHHSLVTVNLVRHFGKGGGVDISGPHGTVLSKNKDSLITAHMVRHFGQSVGSAPDEPLGTITAGGLGKSGLVTSHLVKLRGSCRDGQQVDTPMPTITSGGQHVGEVRAFLIKYFGTDQDPRLNDPLHTVTTKDRFGLVYVKGEAYEIVDIGMRMLTPRELFSAQGFPETYIIDRDKSGKPVSKTAQVARCGNSVCPPIAEAIVSVNMAEERCGTRRAA